MADDRTLLENARNLFAAVLSRVSGRHVPEIERAFRAIRREDFFPDGPWLTLTAAGYVPTPAADAILLQQNLLFAIDAEKGINNGEPSLHAAWLAAVLPKPGEHALHVGCGNGFYSAIIANLVDRNGSVTAFEIESEIAANAQRYLAGYPQVAVQTASAAGAILPASDLIYVNASSCEPLTNWVDALRMNGRLVFPWQAASDLGVSVMITRTATGFSASVLGQALFIPLRMDARPPTLHLRREAVRNIASLLRSRNRAPDETSVAVFDQLWFSTDELPSAEEDPHG
jgi:protein-L-isoaspartate(D-aspartate) O-methyltransferase